MVNGENVENPTLAKHTPRPSSRSMLLDQFCAHEAGKSSTPALFNGCCAAPCESGFGTGKENWHTPALINPHHRLINASFGTLHGEKFRSVGFRSDIFPKGSAWPLLYDGKKQSKIKPCDKGKKKAKSGNDDPFNKLWLIYTYHEAHLAAQESGFATLLNGMIETTSID